MLSKPSQGRWSRDRGWAFRAVMLITAVSTTASLCRGDDETDLPLPLAESLREAGIVQTKEPVARKPAAAPIAASPARKPAQAAAPAPAPAPVPPTVRVAEPVAAAMPALEPAPLTTPVQNPVPAATTAAAAAPAGDGLDNLPPLPGGDAVPAAEPAPVAQPAPAPVAEPVPAPVAEPAPAPLAPAPSEPVAVAPVTPAPVAAPAPADDMDLPPLPADAPAEPVAAPAASPMPAPAPAPAPAADAEPVAPQTPAASLPASAPYQAYVAPTDTAVDKASCPSCGHKLHADGHGGYGGCGSCGRSGQCVPGQKSCAGMSGCQEHYMCRMVGNLYECLCCPDPCYQPSWIPEANAAFFQDFARPRTLSRFRWDHGWQMQFPDRNEFFWARQSTSKGGAGPKFPPKGFKTGKPNSIFGQTGVNYDQIYFYTEAANPKGSLFFEMPYRSNNPAFGPSMSGFADLNFGSKSLLFDTEMLQVTFQFKTFMPTGQASKGLGVAHVSLEPSLLFSLRLAPEAYLQGQFAEWIPLGGDPTYAGALMHYHLSYNQVLWRPMPDTPIIGTFEFNGWSFQDGAYTDPKFSQPVSSSGNSYLTLGPGLRTSICDKIDFGGALAFPVSNNHWANPLLRLELRILY